MKNYLAALLLSFTPIYSNALVIETSVGAFDITTVTGSFSSHKDLLQSQKWWDNEILASEFLSLSAGFDKIGYINTGGNESPFFAYSGLTSSVLAQFEATGCFGYDTVDLCRSTKEVDYFESSISSFIYHWVVAKPIEVSESATFFLYLVVIGGVLYRRVYSAGSKLYLSFYIKPRD
ncbi:hypothetical protein [Teredinibacter franksiae]|uniref:hypothetical protein n=1 Tax=Teredinibacter franksiae TaxID=2761453 RepID=UPI00162595F4|nr:hypothetical protein [Teredinibacter franksiae]